MHIIAMDYMRLSAIVAKSYLVILIKASAGQLPSHTKTRFFILLANNQGPLFSI